MEGLHEAPDEHDQRVEGSALGAGHHVRPLDEAAWLPRVAPDELDALLARGWRHFGEYFFRYSTAVLDGEPHRIVPLRVRLAGFVPSRGQCRVIARNRDLDVVVAPARVDSEREDLFLRHATRFRDNAPESLGSFLSRRPASVPCDCVEIAARLDGRLTALSYLDLGRDSASSVYGVFDPVMSRRSLGVYTMLREIEFAATLGKRHYYPGYATAAPSAYDYKKRFAALEAYDWRSGWRDA